MLPELLHKIATITQFLQDGQITAAEANIRLLALHQLKEDDGSTRIGNFQLILNEDNGELKVIVLTNKDRMVIKPNTDNSCTLVACR
jgi:hypothetical protein